MSLERLLVLIDEGKISASGINPLVLCADTPKSKWPAENLDTFFKRREAILAIREVLPWLKVHSVIEIIQNLFGISSKNHAGQVLYGCSDTDPTKIQRLEVALQSLGIDQEFITSFTKPFYLRKQSQEKEPDSLKEDNSDRLLMAERRFMLERINFELTGERIISGAVLRKLWAERIGISPKAFKPMETSKDWLDAPSARKFARAMVELSERSIVNFNPEEIRIFIEKSVWFRRIEPNYPDALKHYRHLLLAAVSFNEVNSFFAHRGFPLAAFGEAVDLNPKAGSWDEVFLGKKHLQLSEIEALAKKLKSFEINGELAMMLSSVGIMWASPSLLQPVRGVICKAAFRHLEIKRGERNPLGISTDDRRALAHGRTWATASLLPLLTARENRALFETLGEVEGVKFLFRERLSIK